MKCYVHFLRCPCTSWLLRWLAEEAQLSSIVFVRLLLFGSHVTVIYCEQNSLNYIHAWHYVHYIKCKKGHWTPQGLQQQWLLPNGPFRQGILAQVFNSNFKIRIVCMLGDSGDFQTSRYQGIVKATAFGVFEDLKFKISEGSDQN